MDSDATVPVGSPPEAGQEALDPDSEELRAPAHVGPWQAIEFSVEPEQFDDPGLFLNRELALLTFDERVLAQAADPHVPLLERLRFLAICSSNLDEFFEIRVSGLQQRIAHEVERAGSDGRLPHETLAEVSATARALVDRQYRLLNEELLPELAQEGIRILARSSWSHEQREWIREYFENEVLPVISPMGIDPTRPFPKILNKSLNFAVRVSGHDAFGRSADIAVVQVPRPLPRLIPMGPEVSGGPHDFVLLSSVVHAHVEELFPGMRITDCYQFRVTRNSDLWVDVEEVEDLLLAVQGELTSRRYGEAVRLEVADDCSEEMAKFLLDRFGLDEENLYRVNGPVNLNRLEALHAKVARPDLKYPTLIPGSPVSAEDLEDIFEVLRGKDLLLHHPYQSFKPVVELMRQAAADPAVLAIKQTLYRTGDDSPLVAALLAAARAGKDVTAVVELRARFDEAANIGLATRLQEAGAKVVYGIVGYKCHSKMLLVVRREERGLVRYVHLGTGNYHTGTARAYTDISYLTTRRDFGEDVHRAFLQLSSLGEVSPSEQLLQSPFTLLPRLLALIENEVQAALRGEPARIAAKMNSLTDPAVIRELYRASVAGVEIDLVVRGVCCLRPGVPGVSENIRVRSIIGRFLEHSRAFYFHSGGQRLMYCSSADWMERNLYRRVETAFPLVDPAHVERLSCELLGYALEDDVQAWELQSDGSYRRCEPANGSGNCCQTRLLEELSGTESPS